MCCRRRPVRRARPCPKRTRCLPSRSWRHSSGLARCARRLRDGDDPLAVRRAIDRAAGRCPQRRLRVLVLAVSRPGRRRDGSRWRPARHAPARRGGRWRSGAARGWQASPWALTGTAMLAYGKLLAAEPEEAERLATDGLAHGAKAAAPAAIRAHGDCGRRPRGPGDRAGGVVAMARARTALGDASASRFELAALAVAEFQDSVRLGRHAAARTVLSWFVDRVGETAETLLMRVWSDVAVGAQRLGARDAAANPRRAGGCRAAVHPRRNPPAGDRACRPRRGPLRRPSGPPDGGRHRRATRPAPTLRQRRAGGAGASRAALRQPRGRGHVRWEGVGRGSM